jgi:glutamine synthetase
MHSRYEIGLEQYTLSVGVEARLTLEIGTTAVLPAALRYQTEVALNLGALKAAGMSPEMTDLEDLSGLITSLRSGLADLKAALAHHGGSTALEEAQHAQSSLLPAMAAVRTAADKLEGVVADDLWPLPTYQEMLFIL